MFIHRRCFGLVLLVASAWFSTGDPVHHDQPHQPHQPTNTHHYTTSDNVFNVLSYGAVGDGVRDDTLALRKAAAALAVSGQGGTLLLPAGYTFLSQPVNLTSHTNLVIAGTLLASRQNTSLWPLIPPLPWFGGGVDSAMTGAPEWQPLLMALNAENISVSGGGVIDGNGDAWWTCAHGTPPLAAPPCSGFSRPQLLRPTNVHGFSLSDLTLQNSPSWTIHLANVTGAVLSNFSVLAPADQGNTDGVDIDCSRNVVVSDFYYKGGDDAIAVKAGLDWLGRQFGAPTENVLVQRMTVHSGNGFAVGSEMSAGVKGVRFQDVVVDCQAATPCKHGLYIKTMRGRGGVVQDIAVINTTVAGTAVGHGITLEYQRNVPPTNASATPQVHNVTISGGEIIKASTCAFETQGLPESVVTGIALDKLAVAKGVKISGVCANSTGVCLRMPQCPSCLTPNEAMGKFE